MAQEGLGHPRTGQTTLKSLERRPSPSAVLLSRRVLRHPPHRFPRLPCGPRRLDVAPAESHIRVAGEGGDHADVGGLAGAVSRANGVSGKEEGRCGR